MYSELYTNKKPYRSFALVSVAILISLGLGILLFFQDSKPSRASKNTLIQHQIVNVTQKQSGVFWQTDVKDTGWILYGKERNKVEEIALDELSSQNQEAKRLYHYSTLFNLEPDTEYYYRIVSNNEIVKSGNNEIFSFHTLSSQIRASSLSPLYGTVLDANNIPSKNTIVMISFGNSYPLLALSGDTGEWLIPIQYIIGKETNQPIAIDEISPITIQLFNDTNKSLVRSTIERSRPLPQPIILGNNYSFIDESSVLSASSSNTTPNMKQVRSQVEIRYPKDNAVIQGTAPIIKGYGVPGEVVSIEINTNPPIIQRSMVDKEGVWDSPVRKKINPGTYTLNMKTIDKNKKTVRFIRRFTIIKSGEQVLGEAKIATPSGSITPSTPLGTITPSLQPSVTIIITAPSPTIISETEISTPTPEPPVSGVNILPFIITGIGFVSIGLGALILL